MAFTYDTPQFLAANIGYSGLIQTANTAKDGTGTVSTIFTANATNGSRVFRVTALPAGTNTASVLRIWINDGSGFTAADNVLFRELSLPATTLTEVAAQTPVYYDFNLDLIASYRLTCAIGTTVAAGWYVTAFGRDY